MVNQEEFVKVQEELAQVQGVVSELDTKLEGLRDEVVQQFDRTARDMNKLQQVVQESQDGLTKYLEVKMEQMLVTLQGGNAQGILPGEDKSEPQGIKVPSASTFSDGSSSKLTGSNVGIEHPNAQQGTESAKNNGNSQLTGKYVGLEHPSTLQGTECTREFRQSRTPHIIRGVKLSDIGAEGSLNFQMGKGGSLNFPAQFRTIYNKVCAQGSQSVVSLIRIMVILLDSQSSVTVEQHVTTKLVGKDDQQLNEELRKDFWSVLPEKEGSTYDPDIHDELSMDI